MPPLFTHAPGSLCLLRLSAIGDCTHMLPIVHTLQRHWPKTQLTWIVGAPRLPWSVICRGSNSYLRQATGLRAYRELYIGCAAGASMPCC